MTSAISRKATPSSPTACKTDPAGAVSTARRDRRAASERCTAGQRLAPSARYPATPRSRANPTIAATNPWSPSPWTVGGKRNRRADPRAAQGQGEQGRGGPASGGVGPNLGTRYEPVVLGSHPPGLEPEDSRRKHKGPVGVSQSRAHGLYRPSVGRCGGGEVSAKGHLVLKGQVDHAIGVRRNFGQAVGVVDVAPPNDGASCFQPFRRCSWPAASSSGTTAEPIQPEAPVTKILMTYLQEAN
jgi:hypothetical protein